MSQSVPPLPLAGDESSDSVTKVEGTVMPSESFAEPAVSSVFELGRRYEVRQLLGEGGNGRVYAVFDRDLGREVALKTMDANDAVRRDIFVREARVTAGLSHPNVPPLYDVGRDEDVYFLSMHRVRGSSLGNLIREATASQATELMPVGRLVEVMLKMCDAVAYAHAQLVVHGDIKPDNVMIGAFGEVMLVDWGAARSVSEDDDTDLRIIGTPAYMAPEQATGSMPTPLSDIYALGATLFHTLLLRKPLMKQPAEDFWVRKCLGEYDSPTTEELLRVPRPLLSIALKAISADPVHRYLNAGTLADALRDFQAGRTAWAAPLLTESLSDDSYLKRWVSVPEGAFQRSNERLLSSAPEGALLFHRQRLPAGVALEFDGEILPGARPGDLSVVWTDDDVLEPTPHWPKAGTCLSLQVGAFDNLAVGIYRDFGQCLSGRSLRLEVGRRYRIRAEIDEQSLRLLLDGELIAEYEELFPLASGYVAVFSYAPGKAFSNIRLYERGVPERVRPTAIGDAFYGQREYESAAKQYARVEQLLPRTDLAEEARFKRGLCALHRGDASSATAVWERLESERWRARAALHAIDVSFEARRHREVVSELDRLLTAVPVVREAVISRWAEYVNTLCVEDLAPLALYAELRDQRFPEHEPSRAAAAALEVARGNWRTVVDHYGENHVSFVQASNLLGEFQRVAERYPSVGWIRNMARIRLCCFDDPELDSSTRSIVRTLRDDPAGALLVGSCTEALLADGRFQEVLEARHVARGDYAAALRELGRLGEAARLGDARSLVLLDAGEEALATPMVLEERVYLLHHLTLGAFIAGDLVAYGRHRDAMEALPCGAFWFDIWLHRFFLVPLMERELGDEGAPERSAQRLIDERAHHWFGKGSHLARFVLGEIGIQEFEAQPVQLYIRARSLFARALKADFVRDTAEAARSYTEYLALPARERTNDSARGDPVLERWAQFRSTAHDLPMSI